MIQDLTQINIVYPRQPLINHFLFSFLRFSWIILSLISLTHSQLKPRHDCHVCMYYTANCCLNGLIYSGQACFLSVQVWLCQRQPQLLRHNLSPDERGGHSQAHHRVLQHDPLQLGPQLQSLPQKVPQQLKRDQGQPSGRHRGHQQLRHLCYPGDTPSITEFK